MNAHETLLLQYFELGILQKLHVLTPIVCAIASSNYTILFPQASSYAIGTIFTF